MIQSKEISRTICMDLTEPGNPGPHSQKSKEHSASTVSAVEDFDQVTMGKHYDALRKKIVYHARFNVFDEQERQRLYLEAAPDHPEEFWGVSIKDGVVQVRELEEAEYQALFSVSHTVNVADILKNISSCFDIGDEVKNRIVGVFSTIGIILTNLHDTTTVTLGLTTLCAFLGLATSVVGWLFSILRKAVELLMKRHDKRTKPSFFKRVFDFQAGDGEAIQGIIDYINRFKFVEGISLIGGFLFLAISGMIMKVIPKKSDFDCAMMRIKHLPASVRSAKEIADFGTTFFKNVIQAVRKYCFGLDEQEFDAMKGVNEWMSEVTEMMSMESALKIKSDMGVQAKADALYQRGLNISKTFDALKVPYETQMAFRHYLFAALRLREEAHRSGAGYMMPRKEPLVALFYGASGLGKSVLVNAITADLMKRRGAKTLEELANSVYYRKVSQEFWDGFTSAHKIVVIDDFAAVKDSEAHPNPELMEIISSGNVAPYPVHMATLSEKATTFFRAEVLLLTSNVAQPHIVSMSYPEAVYRRMDIRIRVKVKPEFGTLSYQNGQEVYRINADKVRLNAKHFTDPYLFDIVCPNERSCPPIRFSHKDLTYKEMIAILLERDVKKCEHSEQLLETLATYMQSDPVQPGEVDEESEDELNQEIENQEEIRKQQFIGYQGLADNVEEDEFLKMSPFGDSPQFYSAIEKELEIRAEATRRRLDYEANQRMLRQQLDVEAEIAQRAPVMTRHRQLIDKFWRVLGYHSTKPHHIHLADWMNLKVDIPKVLPSVYDSDATIHRVMSIFDGQCFNIDPDYVPETVLALLQSYGKAAYHPERKYEIFAATYAGVGPRNKGILVIPEVCKKQCKSKAVELLERVRASALGFDYADIVMDKAWKERGLEPETRPLAMKIFKGLAIALTMITTVVLTGFGLKFLWSVFRRFMEADKTSDDTVVSFKVSSDFETSGEEQTRSKPKVFVAESNELATKAAEKKFVAESGEERTKAKAKTFHVESAAKDISERLGFPKTEQTRVRRQREVKDKIEEADYQAVLDENASTLISSLFVNNLVKFEIPDEEYSNPYDCGKWRHLLTIAFVRGRIALANRHLLLTTKYYPHCRIRGISCVDGIILRTDSLRFYYDEDHPIYGDRDSMLIVFPRQIRQYRDIIHHFINKEDVQNFSEVTKAALVGYVPHSTIMCGVHVTEKVRAVDREILLGTTSPKPQLLRVSFRYNIETINGSCGSLLVSMMKESQRKICAIHAAGQKDAEYQGCGSPVSQEQLKFLLGLVAKDDARLNADALIAAPELPVIEKFELQALSLPEEVGDYQMVFTIKNNVGQNFVEFGVITDPVRAPGKTEIRRSPLYGKLEGCPSNQAPAVLYPKVVDGVIVNPMEKAVQKANRLPRMINEVFLKEASQDVFSLISSFGDRHGYRRVLTEEEAVRGVEGDDRLTPICRKSSPGYPWIHQKKSGTRGKETWLGREDEWHYHKDLKNAVDLREQYALCAVRYPTFWTDVLKDERRTLERVRQCKTRLFSAGPMDFNILFRKYFLGFCAHIMSNRIDVESTVGVNPYSAEWHSLATRLQTFEGEVIAGDFSNFDGTLNPVILWEVLDIINRWYDGPVDDSIVRIVLWSDIVNSVHLQGEHAIGWWQSQPSGNPITVVVNSIYCMLVFRMAWLEMASEEDPAQSGMRTFHDNVKLACNGDDVLLNVSDRVSDWFHLMNLSSFFETIGMTFTTETKNECDDERRQLSDVKYLKRSFRFDWIKARYVAPLSIETLIEIPQWVRGPFDHHALTACNCELVARELSLHDEETFNKFMAVLKKAAGHLQVRPVFETYSRYALEEFVKYPIAIGGDDDCENLE